MEPPLKKRRGLWSLEQLEAAMAAVQGGVLSQRAAAARYSIPRRTLVNHLKTGKVEKQVGRRTVLTMDQENDLASRIKRLASIGFPLTPKVIRNQAYVFCEQYKINNNFNQTTKRAGKDWLKLFLKRHPDITKRKVQILNPGRAQKLNKPIVMQHFDEYKKIYDELELRDHPQRLYNMDEKGCRLTIHNQPMVLAQKGAKRVHMVAPEHAENVTVAACVNALGNPIPPMIIFKGKRLKPEYRENLPAGSLVKMAPKGSMTSSLFIDFINHLGKYKAAGKCLLVFDGASCHLDYQIVEAADKNDIILYCLPSNTTHELQPLDKSVNKSFEHHWDEETLLFLYRNPGAKLTKARFNSILSKIWSKCMTHQTIVSGFRATGLYPFDPDAIPIEAYAPSVMTERPPEQENVSTENYRSPQNSPTPGPSGINVRHTAQSFSTDNSDSNETYVEVQSSCSPSLLQQVAFFPPRTGINKRIVDYSSSDSNSSQTYLPANAMKPDTLIRRPIIYSSASDSSITEALIPSQRKSNLNTYTYSSSEDENANPLSRQECTPKKQINTSCGNINTIRQEHNDSSISSESEDNIPLENLKVQKNIKSPFQQLIPTPNFAVVKQKPRRKAINYKAQIVTKNLFTERENKKKVEKKEQQKQKRLSKNKNKKIQKKTVMKTIKHKKNNDDDKWYCHACNTENCEDMRQCPACQKWFHEQCLGLTEEDIDFECPSCN